MTSTSFHKRNLAQQVAEQLSQLIHQKQWSGGRRLPAVREIAGQFGVSANTAHAALRLLADKGVVGLRPRQGAYIEGGKKRGAIAPPTAKNQIGVLWAAPSAHEPIGPSANSSERDDWGQRIVRTADIALHDAGYYMTSLGFIGSEGVAAALPRVRSMLHHLAGVICFARSGIEVLVEELDKSDIPWISINAPDRRCTHNFVTADNLGDCTRVGHTLARMGIRRVLMVYSEPLNTSATEKILGIYQGFIERGVSTSGLEVVSCGDWHETAGYEAVLAYLERAAQPPQVIFTSGDFLAMGALLACRERGLSVPQDVGVIGTTGLQMSAFSQPSLSVVAQPMEDLGRNAAQMLSEMAREGVRRMVGRRIPGKLILRDSFHVPPDVRDELGLTPAGASS